MVFPLVSFLLAFPSISYMHPSSPQFVLHALTPFEMLSRAKYVMPEEITIKWRIVEIIILIDVF
jgi:hypothetical protein